MISRNTLVALGAAFLVAVTVQARVHAQGGTALTGVASSQAEGKMEGVVVTARREYYRRISAISDDIVSVADRVWYSQVKEA